MFSTDADGDEPVPGDHAPAPRSDRYEPPQLVVLASLDELTASMGDDGSTGVFFTLSP